MSGEIISKHFMTLIITSVILGTLARFLTLKEDYRQYPSYPNGYLTHLVTGFVASALGAVAIPALITKDFSAFTFLALAIEQFREIRRIETESLQALDDTDYAYRGDAYIDGIAKTFEARNYFSLLVSFVTGLTMQLVPYKTTWLNILCGILAGFLVFWIISRFSKGKSIGDIADVKLSTLEVKGSELYVEGTFVTNFIGLDYGRELLEKEGLAAVIIPREDYFRITLDNPGQRQAILFEVCRAFGLKRYHFTRKDFKEGKIVVVFVPIIRNEDGFIEIIRKTPLLETVKKTRAVMKTNFFGK